MWLINCSNYRLEPNALDGPNPAKYWILSHTWGDEEVSFQDMQDLNLAARKKGFQKIEGICILALKHSCTHVWVDTCCIDKTSSAELTESINSMFSWYRRAEVCIVYLEDLEPGSGQAPEKELRECRWFTRGWTLQELIAPLRLEFYDRRWKPRGTKGQLCTTLHRITNVDQGLLKDPEQHSLFDISVARRMSWAARRETTRIEDQAYCLFGIFGVNMPLIYGERFKAFTRLQQAIAEKTNDMSLFAWVRKPQDVDESLPYSGVFARDPSEFSTSTRVTEYTDPMLPTPSWTITNAGMEINTALVHSEECDYSSVGTGSAFDTRRLELSTDPFCYRLLLNCFDESDSAFRVIAIWLWKTRSGFFRLRPTELCLVKRASMAFTDVHVVRIATSVTRRHLLAIPSFRLDEPILSGDHQSNLRNSMRINWNILAPGAQLEFGYYPEHLWDRQQLIQPLDRGFIRRRGFTVGVVEISISTLIAGQVAVQTCWLLCGKALAVGENSLEDARHWYELVRPEKDGAIPLLGVFKCKGKDLRNPFALSGIVSGMVESGIRPDFDSLNKSCVVQCSASLHLQFNVWTNSPGNRFAEIMVTVIQFDPRLDAPMPDSE